MAISTFPAAAGGKPLKREQTLTSSGVFTVPSGVNQLEVTVVGGGGTATTNDSRTAAGGGGAVVKALVDVEPNEQIPFTVGAGGTLQAPSGSPTVFKSIFAGGGSTAIENTRCRSGNFSFDFTIPGNDFAEAVYLETGTDRGASWTAGGFAKNSEFVYLGHTSNFTNGSGELIFHNFSKTPFFASVSRSWGGIGVDGGSRSVRVIKFKENYIILRLNSPGGGSSGYIEFVPVASVEDRTFSGSVTPTAATLPSGYSGPLLTWEVATPYFEHEGYFYLATQAGVIRTFDGAVWENVITGYAGLGFSGYPTAFPWIDGDGILNVLIVTSMSTSNDTYRLLRTTDATFSAWDTSFGSVSARTTQSTLRLWERGPNVRGIYDPETDRYMLLVTFNNHTGTVTSISLGIVYFSRSGTTLLATTSSHSFTNPAGSTSVNSSLSANFDGPNRFIAAFNGSIFINEKPAGQATFDSVAGERFDSAYRNPTAALTSMTSYSVTASAFVSSHRSSTFADNYISINRLFSGTPGNFGPSAGAGGAGFPISAATFSNVVTTLFHPGAGIDGMGLGAPSHIGNVSVVSNSPISSAPGCAASNRSGGSNAGRPGAVIVRWEE